MLHNNEELFRSEWDDDINISNIAAQDECIRKEILEVENLDNVIHVMNDKVKVNCLYCKIKHRLFF